MKNGAREGKGRKKERKQEEIDKQDTNNWRKSEWLEQKDYVKTEMN